MTKFLDLISRKFYFHLFSHYRSALVQLIKMCRGIGDPLVAAYARCYICRVNLALILL
jgi:hypothetical protein